MPVMQCTRNGEQGWKWGDAGYCYLPSEEGGDGEAKNKAYKQGVAVEGGTIPPEEMTEQPRKMAELLEVPLLKRGVYNGFTVDNLPMIAQHTSAAMPFLMEGIAVGKYREQRDALNSDAIPGFINLNHDTIAPAKLKEWTGGVNMEVSPRMINGEEWLVGNFQNVDPELAQLLSVGFPGRSVEILPDFKNPDTGEVYPIVLRSVAFLDPKTTPAVPQTPGYSVKLSHQNASDVLTVRLDVPLTNHQQEEINDMQDKAQDTVGKPSQDEIQKFQSRLDALESENKALKGAVTDLKKEKDELARDVQTYQKQAHQAGVAKFCADLERELNLTPVGIDLIRPLLNAENGIVKLAAGEKQEKEAAIDTILEVVKLAKKDALFLPQSPGTLPTGKQQEEALTVEQKREKAIQKFMKDGKSYGDAYSMAAKDPETSDLFNPLANFRVKEGK